MSNKIILCMIIALSLMVRIWSISKIPPHLTSDEAALGYNAYSILKTTRDEYGQFLPIIFKSFGDYKPGLYVYLTVPFIVVFGLNEISVRLPGVLAGVIAVFLVYKIFNYFERRKINKKYEPGLIPAFLLAVTPWHIHFSRGAWEVNVALTLTLAGVYYFLRSINSSKYLPVSSVFFSLTLLVYQGAKLSTLLIVIVLVVVFGKSVASFMRNSRKNVAFALILGALIVLPVVVSIFSGKIGRLSVFSVFSYPRKPAALQQFLDQGDETVGSEKYLLYHTETLNFTRSILGRWYNHFSGRFLFFEGDWQNPRHSAPNSGMLLIASLVFLVFGFGSIATNKNKLSLFAVLWLVLAPLPAALSRDEVHAVRALNMVVPLTLISSMGVLELLNCLKKKNGWKRFVYSAPLSLLFVGSLIYYFDAYFVHLPKHDSDKWNYGHKQIVETVLPLQDEFGEIKIQQSFAQPYIFFLFYGEYPPGKYQQQAKLSASEYEGDVGYVSELGNIRFEHLNWSVDSHVEGVVVGDAIVIPDESLRENHTLLKRINFLNGNEAFKIVQVE